MKFFFVCNCERIFCIPNSKKKKLWVELKKIFSPPHLNLSVAVHSTKNFCNSYSRKKNNAKGHKIIKIFKISQIIIGRRETIHAKKLNRIHEENDFVTCNRQRRANKINFQTNLHNLMWKVSGNFYFARNFFPFILWHWKLSESFELWKFVK